MSIDIPNVGDEDFAGRTDDVTLPETWSAHQHGVEPAGHEAWTIEAGQGGELPNVQGSIPRGWYDGGDT
jgi:hypothetical protein